MSPSKTEYYRASVEECCREAVLSEDVDQRSHWLEVAACWLSLARQEGALLEPIANLDVAHLAVGLGTTPYPAPLASSRKAS